MSRTKFHLRPSILNFMKTRSTRVEFLHIPRWAAVTGAFLLILH